MMRLVGAALVLAAAVGLSFWQAARQQRQLQLLNDLITALAALQRELSCRALPWSQACGIAAEQGGLAADMLYLAGKCSAELGAAAAWRLGLQKVAPQLPAEAVAALEQLAASLGCSDMPEQLAAFTAARQRLQAAYAEARQKTQQNRRIVLQMGWSLGLLLVLIFW